ncbi:hypothetical protein F511_36544 [Dorcoceras hygrometricum]|uniref:Uncharacterized protein n=1 Tax=Dorcoceras hygrometricum TaxID=472368 RepID=A0A2Z7D6W8_9LAMI|nr:hypothetical protein F511_36544 [Dorcoceras hygrometricum]
MANLPAAGDLVMTIPKRSIDDRNSLARWPEQSGEGAAAAALGGGRWRREGEEKRGRPICYFPYGNHESSTCVTLNGSGIQLAVGPQPLWLRNHNFGLAQRIMVKRLATSPHDPIGITDSACKNQLCWGSGSAPRSGSGRTKIIEPGGDQYENKSTFYDIHRMFSVLPRWHLCLAPTGVSRTRLFSYGPFNTYIPIRSTTTGKSRVAKDPITMHTSWRSNSDIASVTRASMAFRVVRTNQYNQDLELIHSTNGNHLESPNKGSSIDHQVTIHLHAQNITMFPANETRYFTSQMLVSSSGVLILILTAQSTRNEFRIHSDY